MDQFSNASMSLKFIVSVSISFFTIALSYTSLSQSFRVSFSAFFHTQLIDKNYMFLLCNGILVLLVKNSGLISSSYIDTTNLNGEEDAKKKSSNLSETKAMELGTCNDVDGQLEVEVQERYIEDVEKECCDIIEEAGEEYCGEEEHACELLSTDELNKRCEEFIRKMKQGIKLEGQQIMLVS